MITFGNISLYLATGLTLGAFVLLAWGIIQNDFRFIVSGRRAFASVFIFTTLASISLAYLFATDAFQVEYVTSYSDRALPIFYKATSFWAGQKGSLLFWAWLLSGFGTLVAYNTRDEIENRTTAHIYIVMTAILAFFITLLSTISNPFDLLPHIPMDGNGLNPMLQNPGMIFHPPTLFLGYVGFTVPFAYALAAMMSGKVDESWLRKTRTWSVLSWIFLTIGIVLGGQWAYVELGWGGYWAWDPVENASFIPWLVATAFIHTAIIQERRNIMKVWNMVLIVLTFILSIFGTYLVRSGVLQSVHDFGATGLGGYFLVFMAGITLVSTGLIFATYKSLRTEHSLESYLSRESTFLFNNVILMALTFATLLGTLFPLISEAVTGNKITVSQPFFNRVNIPLFLILLLITGICPLVGWRKASASNLRRNFIFPAAVGVVSALILGIFGIRQVYPLLAVSLSFFIIGTVFQEFWMGTRARSRITGDAAWVAFPGLLWNMRRRYGGFIAHLGVALMVIGITGSSAFQQETQQTLKKGQSIDVGSYTLRYDDMKRYQYLNRDIYAASMSIFKEGDYIGNISPEKRYYTGTEKPTTEVSLRSTLWEDLYVTMPVIGKNLEITIRAVVNPLINWVWIGSLFIIVGGFMSIIPRQKKRRVILDAA